MLIKFYYNFSCPHCFVVLKNLLTAKEKVGIQLDIDFIPTTQRSDDVKTVKRYLDQFGISESFIFERGQDLTFANQMMQYVEDKINFYFLVAEAYFVQHKNITDEKEILKLYPIASSIELEKIKQISIEKYLSNQQPTTLEIGNVIIEGLKDVNYYEFALSCFTFEEREQIYDSSDTECCDGSYCG